MADDFTVEGLLKSAALRFRNGGIDTARLDARVLLGNILGREPSSLLPGDDTVVASDLAEDLETSIRRRLAGEPVARIVGHREFYGRTFTIGPDVLDPRADSEALIELALSVSEGSGTVLDLGTGSGCLLLTILAEQPDMKGLGVDVSDKALSIARSNATALGLSNRVRFMTGNWFSDVTERYDLILSNPPYIPDRDIDLLSVEVKAHDPRLALSGGEDGLQPYRSIMTHAGDHLCDDGVLVVEIGAGQSSDVLRIAADAGLALNGQQEDLGGNIRALCFTLRS